MLLATAGAFSRSLVACGAPATGDTLTASFHKVEMLQSCKVYISEGRDATVIGRLKVILHSACMQSGCTNSVCKPPSAEHAAELRCRYNLIYLLVRSWYYCFYIVSWAREQAGRGVRTARQLHAELLAQSEPLSMQWRCGKGRTPLAHPR